MTIITPTNGRIVWYQKGVDQRHITQRGQPLAAMVCHVWGDRLVNLKVTDADGIDHAVTSVPLMQQGDFEPTHGEFYAFWMPYQTGQAQRAAELKAELDKAVADQAPKTEASAA